MKLTTKAVFLIFLCLFATIAVPFAMFVTQSSSPKRSYAFTVFSPTNSPLGDPIGTPGGGGLPK